MGVTSIASMPTISQVDAERLVTRDDGAPSTAYARDFTAIEFKKKIRQLIKIFSLAGLAILRLIAARLGACMRRTLS